MGKIISVISTKGSVGKTTLIIHLSGYLASIGKKVLLVDADSQQSLSRFFDFEGLDPNIANAGFGKWFTGECRVSEVILKTANHRNIDIIVNDDPKKYLVSKFLRDNAGAVFQLASMLKPLKYEYDYIFLDTEGTDGRDHDGNSVQNAVLLGEPDLVLSVTKTKLQYAMEVLRVVDVHKEAMRAYRFIGKEHYAPLKFIVNEHDRSLVNAQEILRELQVSFAEPDFANAELFKTVVPLKRKFFESYYHDKQFAHEYHDTNKHDLLPQVIVALAEEIFPELVSERSISATGEQV